jgi:hypothetical protein
MPPPHPFAHTERRFAIDPNGYTRAVELIQETLIDHGYNVKEISVDTPDPFNTILGIIAPDETPISLSMNVTP